MKELDNFAKGKLNISVVKITVPAEAGGLGLFNVEEFLMSQQCCWIFRTVKLAGTTGETTFTNLALVTR
jgi:hypothetical protein